MINSEVHWPASPASDHEDMLDDFDQEQLAEGLEIELEDADDEVIALEAAMDNLLKDPGYYKKAIGLTSIPEAMSTGYEDEGGDDTHGSEVLSHKGTLQNPGQSRDLGEDEAIDFFGAPSELVDVPPKNEKYQNNYEYLEDSDVDDEFFQFLEKKVKTTKSYLTYIDDLYRGLLKVGKSEEALLLQHILKRADVFAGESVKDAIERYIYTRNNLVEMAKGGDGVQINYDPATSWAWGVVSFYFSGDHRAGGKWKYDHGALSWTYSVDEIVAGKDPSTHGLDPVAYGAIEELSRKYDGDLLGGLIFLEDYLKQAGGIDWSPPQAITFLDAYGKVKGLGAVEVTDASNPSVRKILEFSVDSVDEVDGLVTDYIAGRDAAHQAPAPAPVSPEPSAAGPSVSQPGVGPQTDQWATYPELKEPWESYASKNNLSTAPLTMLEWYKANKAEHGLSSRRDLIAFLTGVELPSKRRQIALGPAAETSPGPAAKPAKEDTTVAELRSIITDILSGDSGLGRRADNKMLRYLERAGGSEEDIEPLVELLVDSTTPKMLRELLDDEVMKYNSILRQSRRVTRKREMR